MKSLNEYLCACSTAGDDRPIDRQRSAAQRMRIDYGTKPLDDELRRGGGRLRERRLERSKLPVRQLPQSPQ